jgi:hypothetical protein
MSSDRDTTRTVRSWLDEGVTALPDRVLDAVLDQVPTTPQRRAWWPAWRSRLMNNVRIALATAAVVVAAFIGYQLLGGPGVGDSQPTPQPTAIPTPTPQPTPAENPPVGALEPGTRYHAIRESIAFTFAVPTTGWRSDGQFWFTGHAESGSREETIFFFATLSGTPGVFDDPCAHEGLREFDASLAGNAEAFASLPGTELVSGPSDVTVDGRPGKLVEIAVPEDVGCANSEFWLTYDASCSGVTVECTIYPSWLGETRRAWYVDVDGTIFQITAEIRHPDASAALDTELQQIVDSIQFE